MICLECGEPIGEGRKKFCSRRCSVNYNARVYRERHKEELLEKQRKYPPVGELKKICPFCKKEFSPNSRYHPHQKFCSKQCGANFNRKKYYWKNPEKFREKARKYPSPEEREEKTCEFCGNKFKPTSRYVPHQKYCKDSNCIKKRQAEYRKKMYNKHREKRLEYSKKYYSTDEGKERRRIHAKRYGTKRRIQKLFSHLESEGINQLSLSKDEIKEVENRDNHKCVYCDSSKNITRDHIYPVGGGGWDIKDNNVLACESCNASKQNKDVRKWCKSKGMEVPSIVNELLNKLDGQIREGSLKLLSGEEISSLYDKMETLPRIEIQKQCKYCRGNFTTTTPKKEYCSAKCRERNQYERESKKLERQKLRGTLRVCPTCGTEFELKACNQIYCTKKCFQPRVVKCKSCREEKEIYGHNMCRSCWKKQWRLKRK